MIVTPGDLEFTNLPGRRSADPFLDTGISSSVRIVELERTEQRKAHRHPQSEEIMYVTAGAGQVWVDGVLHPVRQGDVIHIPKGAAHATIPAPGGSMRLVCYFPHPHLASNLEETDVEVT